MLFDESSLIYGAGTLLGDGDQEIKLLVGKPPFFGEIHSNDSHHIGFEGERKIQDHPDPFFPCLLWISNTGVCQDVFNNDDLVLLT